VKNNSSSRKWLLKDMRDQFHIYTSRKTGEIIEENSTFKHEGKVKEPDIHPNTGGIMPRTQWVSYEERTQESLLHSGGNLTKLNQITFNVHYPVFCSTFKHFNL
jgi:hypothetical protein